MKTQTETGFSILDIDLIPKIQIRISVPDILNMKYKFKYRQISLGFRWITFYSVLQINF